MHRMYRGVPDGSEFGACHVKPVDGFDGFRMAQGTFDEC